MLSKDLPNNEELGLGDITNNDGPKDISNLGLDDMLGGADSEQSPNEDLIDSPHAEGNETEGAEDENKETPKEEKAEPKKSEGSKGDTKEGNEGGESEEPAGDLGENEDLLSEILGDASEAVDEAQESTSEVIEKIDEVKDSVSEGDQSEAIKLLDEMNSELISVKADLAKYQTEADIYKAKLKDTNEELSNTKANSQEYAPVDNADLAKLNRMYTDALDGDESSVKKATKTLEDMYYTLTKGSFEDKEVSNANDKSTTNGSLGESSSPSIKNKEDKIEEPFNPQEGVGLNDFLG